MSGSVDPRQWPCNSRLQAQEKTIAGIAGRVKDSRDANPNPYFAAGFIRNLNAQF